MMKKLVFYTTIILLISTQVNSQSVGSAAPDFTVTLLDEGQFTLSDQEGKVVLVFFFGNSCPSCIGVSPTLEQKILNVYSSNPNFTAIGIDAWDGNASAVSSFKSQSGLEIPLGLNGSSIVSSYGSNYDRLLVVDSEGILRHKSSNLVSNDINTVITVLDQYLAGTASVHDINSSKEISLYPNPTSEYLNIKIDTEESGNIDIKLFDATGRLVKHSLHDYNSGIAEIFTVRVNDIPKGIYLLSVNSVSKNYISKVFVTE